MSTERDTHFAGAAKALFQKMLDASNGHIDVTKYEALARAEYEQCIAQFAYDLVAHILKQTPTGTRYIHLFQDMSAWPEQEAYGDLLADLAKIESKIKDPGTS